MASPTRGHGDVAVLDLTTTQVRLTRQEARRPCSHASWRSLSEAASSVAARAPRSCRSRVAPQSLVVEGRVLVPRGRARADHAGRSGGLLGGSLPTRKREPRDAGPRRPPAAACARSGARANIAAHRCRPVRSPGLPRAGSRPRACSPLLSVMAARGTRHGSRPSGQASCRRTSRRPARGCRFAPRPRSGATSSGSVATRRSASGRPSTHSSARPSLIDYLLRTSPTLAQGLSDKAKFAPVEDELCRCEWIENGDTGTFVFRGSAEFYLPAGRGVRGRATGRGGASAVRSDGASELNPVAVRFRHAAPSATTAQRKFFRSGLEFRAASFEVEYRAQRAATPVTQPAIPR